MPGCQVMKKLELIRILGLSIFFRSHGVNINKLLNQNNSFVFTFSRKTQEFFFARERNEPQSDSYLILNFSAI